MSRSCNRSRVVAEPLERRVLLSAAMLHNFGTTPVGSNPTDIVAINGTIYFQATEPAHGSELWKSDGTAPGTQLVKDIVPGPDGSYPTDLTDYNGTLYFVAHYILPNSQRWQGLWKSDGTPEGTVLVTGVNQFPVQTNLTAAAGKLFYVAGGASAVDGLWVSDGTTGGTMQLTAVNGRAGASPEDLTAVGSLLYFAADDGNGNLSIWKSDGTATGTALVKDFPDIPLFLNLPGPGPEEVGLETAVVWSRLFFTSTVQGGPDGLWVSDGTSQGTVNLPNVGGGNDLTPVGSTLFFAGPGGLWKTDGTAAGTVMVKQGAPADLTVLGESLFFTDSWGLWKSDGTAVGTTLVENFTNISSDPVLEDLTSFNGKLYFAAGNYYKGTKLWSSDGTAQGTQLVANVSTRSSSGNAYAPVYTPAGNLMFFAGDDGVHGDQLWATDGTTAGTHMVLEINPSTNGLGSTNFTPSDGNVFFTTDNPTQGGDLWVTDGTWGGTIFVTHLHSYGGPQPGTLVDFNGMVYYDNDDGHGGTALWKTDGTVLGTQIVKDIPAGDLTNVNGALYFYSVDVSGKEELYRSDGTTAGTVPLFPLTLNDPIRLIDLAGKLLVGDFGSIYALNDTSTGLVRLGNGGVFSYRDNYYSNEIVSGNYLYYLAGPTPDLQDAALYRTDGTPTGTQQILDFGPETSYNVSSYPPFPIDGYGYMADVNGAVYFVVADRDGDELWKTDGTFAGTTFVKDFSYPGVPAIYPSSLTNLNGTLYFIADDIVHGRELWKSDGTEQGTVMVTDINPGFKGSGFLVASRTPALWAAGGLLYFGADDGTHGYKLWRSDGTAAGTQIAENLSPAIDGLAPSQMLAYQGWLYLSADDGLHGQEPWAVGLPGTLSGSVFDDLNHNGIQDPGEPGMANVTVYLEPVGNTTNAPGVRTAITDTAGAYTFLNVAPGQYNVREVVRAGYAQTAPLGYGQTVNMIAGQSADGPVFGNVSIASVPMDFNYFVMLARNYGQPGTFATGDVNGDGRVDFDDIVLLAQNYGHSLVASAASIGDNASPADLLPAAVQQTKRIRATRGRLHVPAR